MQITARLADPVFRISAYLARERHSHKALEAFCAEELSLGELHEELAHLAAEVETELELGQVGPTVIHDARCW